jgi:hypothetical protein
MLILRSGLPVSLDAFLNLGAWNRKHAVHKVRERFEF